jgi:hypothetical protein
MGVSSIEEHNTANAQGKKTKQPQPQANPVSSKRTNQGRATHQRWFSMIKVNRNAPGQVMLRDLFRFITMIAVAWLALIGTWFMIWLTYWSLA